MTDNVKKMEIEALLESLPEDIEKIGKEKDAARETWENAEAGLEREIAKITQTEKAKIIGKLDEETTATMLMKTADANKALKILKMKMPTIEDLRAIATQSVYDQRLQVIKKESLYRAKVTEHERAVNDFTVAQERNWNYRQELKALRG